MTSGIDYWIIFQAIKGAGEDGYAAIDNLDFVPDEECVTLPASAEPVECGPGHIECGDHTCIGLVRNLLFSSRTSVLKEATRHAAVHS